MFICGGAFEGLDKIIKERTDKKTIGFGASLQEMIPDDKYQIYEKMLPEDLLKFGLIPEFVGRLPILATLKELDREALLDIMTKPKNALTKQYKKLLELDEVELKFSDESLNSMVDKAIERKTGARGLRSIMEDTMRDIMYEIPSDPQIIKCTITRETVENHSEPELVRDENKKERNTNKRKFSNTEKRDENKESA